MISAAHLLVADTPITLAMGGHERPGRHGHDGPERV